MRTIVLIACASMKKSQRAKAKDIYVSTLFCYSLKYAYSLNPDKVFILSALHHLLDLDKEIDPYDVTLSIIPKKKRKPGLKILNSKEKEVWGNKVIDMLSKQADLQNDKFIVLAGQEYIKPIRADIKNLDDRLVGFRQGERVKYLKSQLQCS
jgi:hypothetical protein